MKNKGKLKEIEILEVGKGVEFDVYKNYYKKDNLGFEEFNCSTTINTYKNRHTAEKIAEKFAEKYGIEIIKTYTQE